MPAPMKTITLFILVLAAAAAATFLAGVAAGTTLLLAGALAPIALLDYSRQRRVLRLPAQVALGARLERLGLAA